MDRGGCCEEDLEGSKLGSREGTHTKASGGMGDVVWMCSCVGEWLWGCGGPSKVLEGLLCLPTNNPYTSHGALKTPPHPSMHISNAVVVEHSSGKWINK